MAYNTQAIKTDVNGKPIPQYFNAQQDQYEALLGQDGAARAILYGPDGQPIGTSGNPLQVKAQDTDDVLEQVKTALEALATEDKLEAVRRLLQTLDGKAATSQGQADIIEAIGTLAGLVATESGQTAIASAITSLAQAVATETTLDDVKTAAEALAELIDSGALKTILTGSNLALRQTIVTGSKTVTSTAAEIFAGASRLDNRHAMVVTNTGADIVYIGAVGVTTSNGFPIFPQDTLRIEFDPTSSVGVFACTSGPNVQVRVVELA